ncbi:class I SAM-dependent methyltransferase [Kinneretia aquatilis]|uniref:class I SAM-dependent methyltransferase n=1 Tax=Kinneretia aquatilis TaxID=2070761 RepID=UPI001CBC7FB8|nr:SAM-dependent methyltransferase [Paucibacter aquatile]WIV97914.1 SAM-dependent methyltransferase [Paucibacter aquatile]
MSDTAFPLTNADPALAYKLESIAIAGVADLQIRSLLDRQQFSDPLGEAEALGISSATWPLFGLLWPSGLRLAEAMALRPLVEGESILEIGCGLGLASLVSHRRGALVTASDCHPLAGHFLMENLRLNDLPPMRYCHGDWSGQSWDEELLAQATAAASAKRHPATARRHRPRVQGRFDLIMGSDILYERDDGGALCGFIERHALPHCEVLVVDPNRGNRSAFSKRMAGLGFALDDRLLRSAPEAAEKYSGHLLRFQR